MRERCGERERMFAARIVAFWLSACAWENAERVGLLTEKETKKRGPCPRIVQVQTQGSQACLRALGFYGKEQSSWSPKHRDPLSDREVTSSRRRL